MLLCCSVVLLLSCSLVLLFCCSLDLLFYYSGFLLFCRYSIIVPDFSWLILCIPVFTTLGTANCLSKRWVRSHRTAVAALFRHFPDFCLVFTWFAGSCVQYQLGYRSLRTSRETPHCTFVAPRSTNPRVVDKKKGDFSPGTKKSLCDCLDYDGTLTVVEARTLVCRWTFQHECQELRCRCIPGEGFFSE